MAAGHVQAMQRIAGVYKDGGLGQAANATQAGFWDIRLKLAARNMNTDMNTAAKKGSTP